MSRGKYYTPEFKEQAAKKVVEGSLKVAQVARELDVNDTTLGCWVAAYRKKVAGNPLPAGMPESERVKELERRVRDLEMENAFLKKARWIELRYNKTRLHSTLGYRTPQEVMDELLEMQAAA